MIPDQMWSHISWRWISAFVLEIQFTLLRSNKSSFGASLRLHRDITEESVTPRSLWNLIWPSLTPFPFEYETLTLHHTLFGLMPGLVLSFSTASSS